MLFLLLSALGHAGKPPQCSVFTWITHERVARSASATTPHTLFLEALSLDKYEGPNVLDSETATCGSSSELGTDFEPPHCFGQARKQLLNALRSRMASNKAFLGVSQGYKARASTVTLPAPKHVPHTLSWSPSLSKDWAGRHCKNTTQLCIIIVLYLISSHRFHKSGKQSTPAGV